MPWRLGGKGKRSAAPTRREDPGETHDVKTLGKPMTRRSWGNPRRERPGKTQGKHSERGGGRPISIETWKNVITEVNRTSLSKKTYRKGAARLKPNRPRIRSMTGQML